MQVGGIGGNEYHYDSHAHMVSKCVHDDDSKKKKSGSAVVKQSASRVEGMPVRAEDGNFSLFQWAGKLFWGAKRLLGRIWGMDASGPSSAEMEENSLKVESAGKTADKFLLEMAAQTLTDNNIDLSRKNPYFTPVDNTGEAKNGMFERLRFKVQAAGDFLKGRFAFAGRHDFNANQERNPRENLRKRSTYKDSDMEVDCTITDDSYLMDSYNKKGGYSQISTKR